MASSSSSGSPPSSAPSPQVSADPRDQQYRNIIHYTSIGALILCPVLIVLPPRKFDIYTVSLLAGTGLGGNQVLQEYTGRGVQERWRSFLRDREQASEQELTGLEKRFSIAASNGQEIPILQEKSPRGAESGKTVEPQGILSSLQRQSSETAKSTPRDIPSLIQELEARKADMEKEMGKEQDKGKEREKEEKKEKEKEETTTKKASWRQQRDKLEKEALEQGRGYVDLIVDQIWEVWNWGRGGR
jgi:hypothetical protein